MRFGNISNAAVDKTPSRVSIAELAGVVIPRLIGSKGNYVKRFALQHSIVAPIHRKDERGGVLMG